MIRHKNLIRIGISVLLFIAFLGPWGYHHDSPPAEWCQKPFLLLENGSCAGRQPGTYYLLFAAVSFPVLILGLFSRGSTLPDLLLVSLGTLLFLTMFCLPVISTFLLMRSSASQKQRTFSVIAWGLAATLGTFLALSAEVIHPAQLWGIWLFILLAVVLLAFERLTAWLENIPSVNVSNDVDNPATGQDQRSG